MRRLFFWPLDPAARTIRLALAEKQLPFEAVISPPWKPAAEVSKLKPGAAGPLLLDQGGHGRVIAVHTHAVIEFLEETYSQNPLLPSLPADRAESRRIWRWVETRFDTDVNGSLLAERFAMAMDRSNEPDSKALRQGAHAMRGLLTYLDALASENTCLVRRSVSVADLACAAQLSALDYFGDVDWEKVPNLKEWYARIKSRPSFRDLLKDRLEGHKPVSYYDDLDF